jgi:hypothetical protein
MLRLQHELDRVMRQCQSPYPKLFQALSELFPYPAERGKMAFSATPIEICAYHHVP